MTKIGGVSKSAVTPSVDVKNQSYASHPSAVGAASPQSSTTYIPPPTLRPTSPYAVYFCLPHMIKVLTAAGIYPRRRGHNAPDYILKLHPLSSLTPPALATLFRSSRLRGKCEALLVVDLSASLSSGTTWEVDADGMYCSNDVPLPPSHLHSACTNKMGQLTKAWENDTAPGPPRPSPAPPPSGPDPTLTHPLIDSQADHRLRTHTQAPLPPQIPPEEETPMEDVGQNDPLQLSNSTRAALDQLLSQIDQATSTVETHLTADSYAALAALPLSYPWSCLVLDLKELLPILDRYVLSCIIASRSSNFLPLMRPQMRAPQPVSNKSPTSPCPPYSPTNLIPSIQPVQRRRKATSLPLPSLYLLNLKHLFKQRDLIGFYAFRCHPPILAPTDASPPLHPTIMAPAHLKPLTLLSVMLPIFHTMTSPLHTLTQLPLYNSRTQPLGLETSDAPLQNPLLLLHRMSKAGYSQAPFDYTPRLSINFLGPILLISPPSLKAISLVTSAWINL